MSHFRTLFGPIIVISYIDFSVSWWLETGRTVTATRLELLDSKSEDTEAAPALWRHLVDCMRGCGGPGRRSNHAQAPALETPQKNKIVIKSHKIVLVRAIWSIPS